MSSPPQPVTLAFTSAPCECVRQHVPVPASVELHHQYPQALQIKKYGKVVDKTTVSLCGTAHNNVHDALTRRLRGEDYRLGNRYQQSIVEAGLAKILAEDEEGSISG